MFSVTFNLVLFGLAFKTLYQRTQSWLFQWNLPPLSYELWTPPAPCSANSQNILPITWQIFHIYEDQYKGDPVLWELTTPLLFLLLPFPLPGLQFLPHTFSNLKNAYWPFIVRYPESVTCSSERFHPPPQRCSASPTWKLLCRNHCVPPARLTDPQGPRACLMYVSILALRSMPSMHEVLSECWHQGELHVSANLEE